MKLSAGVEWAIHCCVVLSQADGPVPAHRLAEFHGVSRTYLAKSLQALSRAGLVSSTEGRVGGYVLDRDEAGAAFHDVGDPARIADAILTSIPGGLTVTS